MATEQAPRDENSVPSILFKGSDGFTHPVEGDETTGRLYVDIPGGSGTVTSVSVVSANGFAGTVATATTTPAITLSTSITGILKGNGTAISAVTIGSGLSFDGTTLSATGGSSGITIGTTTITSGTNTRILYNNAGVVGEYTLTGSGTVVAMQTSPSFVTPDINTATADSLQAGTTSSGLLILNNDGVTVASFGVGSAASTNIALSGSVALGANNLTMTGSLAATGSRVTKGWFTDIESTNMPTVGGTSLTTVAQTLQNKTITNSNNVLGGVTMTLGSDADGDTYYRASNVLTRVAKGTAGQVYTMNAGATAPEWQDAGGTVPEDVAQAITVTLSSANIQAMNATPVTLIAAPGAGKILVFDQAVFSFTHGGVTYTSGGAIRIQYNTLSTNLMDATNIDSMITAASSAVRQTLADASTTALVLTGGDNKALEITNASAAFATGNGTMKIFIRYRTITL